MCELFLIADITIILFFACLFFIFEKDLYAYSKESDYVIILIACVIVASICTNKLMHLNDTPTPDKTYSTYHHTTTKPKKSTSTTHTYSSYSSSSSNAYDDGYDDYYENGDYDQSRYDSDSSYRDGVDDAMDDEY